MTDAWLEWKGDLDLSPDGDLRLAEGEDEATQSIERRLFTAAGAYLWAPEYGAGLPQRIGKPAQARVIAAIVRAQLGLEATVASVPVPKIAVTNPTSDPGLFAIDIAYTNAVTGVPVAISLEVPGTR